MFVRMSVVLVSGISFFSACTQKGEGTEQPGRTEVQADSVATTSSSQASPGQASPSPSARPDPNDDLDPDTALAQRVERFERVREVFELESVDNKWGAPLASAITQHFRAALAKPDHLAEVNVTDAECRYATCLVEVKAPDNDVLRKLTRVAREARFSAKSPEGEVPGLSLASRPDPAGGVMGRFTFQYAR